MFDVTINHELDNPIVVTANGQIIAYHTAESASQHSTNLQDAAEIVENHSEKSDGESTYRVTANGGVIDTPIRDYESATKIAAQFDDGTVSIMWWEQ